MPNYSRLFDISQKYVLLFASVRVRSEQFLDYSRQCGFTLPTVLADSYR